MANAKVWPFLAAYGNKHTDPQVDNVKTVRDFGALNPKWNADALIKAFPLEAQELHRRGGGNIATSRRS